MHLNPVSTSSYWLQDAPYQAPNPDPLPAEADIVIVGAGLTGMSTAYWLQQFRPDLKVVIVDARGVSSGATGRNGGIISPGLNDDFEKMTQDYGEESAERMIQFDYRNTEMLSDFLDKHSDKDQGAFDPELTWTKGTIIAWSSPQEAAHALAGAKRLASLVDDINVLEPDQLQQMLPTLPLFRFGGLHVRTTAIAWAAKIVFCLARQVMAHPNKPYLATHTRVEHVDNNNTVYTSRGPIRARRVAFCTNAWTPHVLPELKPVLKPVRNQVTSSTKSAHKLEYVVSANYGYQYLSCRPNGDLIMGGMRDIVPSKQEYEDDDSSLNTAVSQALNTFMRDVLEAPVEKEWVGVMGFTRDRLPLVGHLADISSRGVHGQYVAAGFTGHGMPRTYLSGRALAQLLTEQPLDDWFPKEFLLDHSSRKSWWAEAKLESKL